MRRKVTIIGAGNTGAATAFWLAARDQCDIVLLDVIEGLAEGKAMDLQEAMSVYRQSTSIRGTNDYRETADSDLIVLTAGLPRKQGMSRDDLLQANASVVAEAVEQSIPRSPQAVLIVLTNPVDPLTYFAFRKSGLPKHRVLGQSGILDSARWRFLLARELGVSVESVDAIILGAHGDGMVPMLRHSTVCGVPVQELLPAETLAALTDRVRNRGAEIIRLLKTSAYIAPGAALAEMVEAILHDTHRVLPCSAYCEGEYGLHGLYFGVPVQIGHGGLERIVELPLNAEEQAALQVSADTIREVLADLTPFLE